MTGSIGKYRFNFLRNCQVVFQSGCTILYSFQQYVGVPAAPYLCQHLMWPAFNFSDSECMSVSYFGSS